MLDKKMAMKDLAIIFVSDLQKKTYIDCRFFVRRIGFEPTHPFVWALPPQGSASTSFAIAAG
jgi:hypothetical protein